MSSFLWNIGGVKNNFNAITDPTINDDISNGYSKGSIWINCTPPEKAYILVDNTSGSAVWEEITDVLNSLSLESVLNGGNTTADGQTIDAENGNGSLNLRNGTDGKVKLSGDEILFEAGQTGVTDVGAFGATGLASSMFIFKSDFSKIGEVAMYNNDGSNRSNFNFPSYPAVVSSQNGTMNMGVVNSVLAGGIDIIMKTNNTTYVNQIAFNTGEAFETILENVASTADRAQTLQDDDGTLALLKNLAASQGYFIQNILTTTALTQNEDDWSPTGFDDDTDLIRVDPGANNRGITGIPAPPIGVNRILGIKNISTGGDDFRFFDEDPGSAIPNRLSMRDNGNKSIKPNETGWIQYDHVSLRWTPFNRIG